MANNNNAKKTVETATQKLARLMAEMKEMEVQIAAEKAAQVAEVGAQIAKLPGQFALSHSTDAERAASLKQIAGWCLAVAKGTFGAGKSIIEGERSYKRMTDAERAECLAALRIDHTIKNCNILKDKYSVSFPTVYNIAKDNDLTNVRSVVAAVPVAKPAAPKTPDGKPVGGLSK